MGCLSPYSESDELFSVSSQFTGRGAPDRLDELLRSGADPNHRPKEFHTPLREVKTGWASQDPPPQFAQQDAKHHFPLYSALGILDYRPEGKEERQKMVASLLQHGADPFAPFPQAFYRPPPWAHPRAPFPGEDPPRRGDRDLDSDYDPEEWWEGGVPENPEDEMEEENPVEWGIRHVLHTSIKDGGRSRLFMNYPRFLESLDVNHRDPQGSTLLLSACRSSLGADAYGGAGDSDLVWNTHGGGYISNPFPIWDRDSGPKNSDRPVKYSDSETETLVDVLLRLGADPLAVDNEGKSSLHHLLVETCNQLTHVPVVRRTLRIFVSKYASLVNQPDHHGTYPLHAALRRKRLHPSFGLNESTFDLMGCVREIMNGGADLRVKDGKGNTALHYLADDDLTGIWFSTDTRQLFYELLGNDGGSDDINLPNKAGKTIAELILEDNGRVGEKKEAEYGLLRHSKKPRDLREWEEVDAEVFGKLDEVGVDWKVKTSDGGTLLHLVARSGLEWERSVSRSRFLTQKGISIMTKDAQGRTAREVAIATDLNKKHFYRALEEMEKAEDETLK